MEAIARFMIASTDLIEAEGRVFKRVLSRFLLATGAGVVAVFLAIAGLGLAIYGTFTLVARLFGSAPLAALLFALIALGLAFVALLMARKFVRS